MIAIRICVSVAVNERLRRGFRLSRAGSAGAIDVLRLDMSTCGRAATRARRARHAMREVLRTGVTYIAPEDGCPYTSELLRAGGSAAPVGRLITAKMAEMAAAFARSHGAGEDTQFVVHGGGYAAALECAAGLARFSRHITLDCTLGADVAEALLDETGAVAKLASEAVPRRGGAVDIYLSAEDGGEILKFKNFSAKFSDFSILLPQEYKNIVPKPCSRSFAAALISCGFLSTSDIDIELHCEKIQDMHKAFT